MKSTEIAVNQIPSKQTTSQLLAEKMTCLLNNVRERAYELFARRGRNHGYDVDDWLRAEAELGALPTATIEETETEVRIRVGRSGLSANELKVYAEPQAITVEGSGVQTHASDDSENRTERILYGRYELPVGINTKSVTADLKDGVLEIVARKIAPAAEKPRQEKAKSAPPQKDRSAAA